MKMSKIKAVYDESEISFTEDWCTADYRTAEKQRVLDRAERNEKKLSGVGAVKSIIASEDICSFSYLVKYVDEHYPELSGIVLEKAPYFGRIVDSKRYDVSCGFSDFRRCTGYIWNNCNGLLWNGFRLIRFSGVLSVTGNILNTAPR